MATIIPARSDMHFEQIRLLFTEYRMTVVQLTADSGECG
jgi:hypothetical protein